MTDWTPSFIGWQRQHDAYEQNRKAVEVLGKKATPEQLAGIIANDKALQCYFVSMSSNEQELVKQATKLKSSLLPWIENETAAQLVNTPLNALDRNEILQVTKALDARLVRLWDKIAFERKHGLINYGKFEKTSP